MRVLIFGTCYLDREDKRRMAAQWWALHGGLNPGCDRLLVDSASPLPLPDRTSALQLGDNIGHLSRGGRDGWGRAFCAGLRYAIDHGYDHAVHIEGDSLFRLPVLPIIQRMTHPVLSVPVAGTVAQREQDWVETGLMVFNVAWLRESGFIERYDWRDCESKRRYPHTPEWHVHKIVEPHLMMMPWRAERGDRGQITAANACQHDWITHVAPEVADAFVQSVMEMAA